MNYSFNKYSLLSVFFGIIVYTFGIDLGTWIIIAIVVHITLEILNINKYRDVVHFSPKDNFIRFVIDQSFLVLGFIIASSLDSKK